MFHIMLGIIGIDMFFHHKKYLVNILTSLQQMSLKITWTMKQTIFMKNALALPLYNKKSTISQVKA